MTSVISGGPEDFVVEHRVTICVTLDRGQDLNEGADATHPLGPKTRRTGFKREPTCETGAAEFHLGQHVEANVATVNASSVVVLHVPNMGKSPASTN